MSSEPSSADGGFQSGDASLLFEAHPQPMWVFDLQSLRFLAVNQAACHAYGYSREEFLAMSIADIRPPEDVHALRLQLDRPHGTSLGQSGVWRHLRKDGGMLHVEISYNNVDFQGRPARLVHAHDITERMQAEQALASSRSRLRAILDSEPECVKLVSTEGLVLDMNRAGLLMLQALDEPQRVLGQPVINLVHPDHRDEFMALHQHCLQGESGHLQFRLDGLQGADLWMESHSTVLREHDGQVAGVLSITRDITAQRSVEKALRASEQRLSLLAKVLVDTVWDWDLALGKIWFSDSLLGQFGYQAGTFSLAPEVWAQYLHPDDREATLDSLSAAIKSDAVSWEREFRYQRSDGRSAWVLSRALLLRDQRGYVYRVVGGASDITERRAMEEQLRRAQRMDSLGQLTGGVAHDFNNLLTVIIGNAELLELQLADQPALAEMASMVLSAAERGASLTQRLLAFARRQPLQPRAVDVNALLTEMAALLGRSLGEQVEMRFACLPGLWAALVDPAQLESALLNLCLNARDAMPDGGRLQISTDNVDLLDDQDADSDAVIPGRYVRVQVSDTGTGIPGDLLEKVFEPFFTTKEPGKGSGLGLSMVYGFARQSRGHVHLKSEPGGGTCIDLLLPVAPAPLADSNSS